MVASSEFGYFKAKQEHKYQLAVLDVKMRASQANIDFKKFRAGLDADAEELKTLYKTYNSDNKVAGFLNSLVRPLAFYLLFGVYLSVKVGLVVAMMQLPGGKLGEAMISMWTQQDELMLTTMMAFYFGSRAFAKFRGK